MKGSHVALIFLAIIIGTGSIAGVMYLNGNGYKAPNLTPNNVATTTTTTGGPIATTTTTTVAPTSWASAGTHSLVLTNNDRDYLASSTLTEATNVANLYYTSADGGNTFAFAGIGTTSASGQTINLNPANNGIFYIVMQPVSGQNYYIAPLATKNSNPCIAAYDFMDIQGSGTKQWVFQCNMANSGIAPSALNAGGLGGTAPLMPLYTMAYAYTAPTAGTNTAKVNSIGLVTTDKSNAVLYTLTGTSKNAFALTELDMKVNSTNSTRFNPSLSYWQFPTQNAATGAISTTQLFFSSANQNYNDGTNTYWKYTFTSPLDTQFGVAGQQTVQNLKGAYFYTVAATVGTGQIPFTANIVTDYQGSTTHLGWTMTAFYIQPSGAIGSVSQAVALCSDTSC